MRRAATVVTLTALIAVLAAAAAPVEAARTPREQTMPAVVYNPHPEIRSYLLVWVEDRGRGPNIYAKRLFNNGLPQGGPQKGGWGIIRDNSAYNRRVPEPGPRTDPALVWNNAREEYLLVFSEFKGDEHGWDVFAVRVSTAGFSRTQPRLIAGGPGDQRRPDVALTGDSEYLVVWDDNTRDIDEIWAQRLHANSIPRGQPYPLMQGPSNASDPTTNGSIVAWVDDRNGNNDIYAMRVRNGLPRGDDYPVRAAATVEDEFAPRYGSGGLLWNVFNAASGNDIRGARVYQNDRTRGGAVGILVPAADQSWPDADRGVVVFADNRSGEYDLYAVRLAGNIRTRGREYPVLIDYDPYRR